MKRAVASPLVAVATLVLAAGGGTSTAAGAASGSGSSSAAGLGASTIQLSDLPARYKQTAAHPVSNAEAINEGTSPQAVRRYGRVGGFEREFESKDPLEVALKFIMSRVVMTHTVAGSHGAFLYATSHVAATAGFRPVAIVRAGAESSCYDRDTKSKGFTLRTYFCIWRQGRLIGELLGVGLRGKPSLVGSVQRLVAQQATRMASFR